MKIKWIGSAFVCLAFTFGCGGGDDDDGSGVDPTLELGELEAAEVDAVCDFASTGVDEREVDCDGEIVVVDAEEFAADCVDLIDLFGPDCAATVGEMEDCLDDIAVASDDEICDPDAEPPVSCDAIIDDPTCGG